MDVDLSCFEGKETEHNWEQRDKSFKSLIEHYSTAGEGQALTSKLPELLACLHTPRTQLMNSTCLFIQCIAQHSILTDSQQELILSNLIKLMSSTKKIAAVAAVNAAKPVCHLMKSDKLLSMLWQGLFDKNASLRARLMEVIEEVWMNVYEGETFAMIMRRAIVDANPEVRQRAGRILHMVEAKDAAWMVTFSGSLDASDRKQLSQLKGKNAGGIQAVTKPDLLTIIAQQKVSNTPTPDNLTSESVLAESPKEHPVDETDDEVIISIKSNVIKPVVDALPNLSIEDIEPPVGTAADIEMTPIAGLSSSSKKNHDNYSILLGSPRRRIESLGLAMSTPMRRILDESNANNNNKTPTKRSSPLPLTIFELLMKRIEEDTPSRLSSLHKLGLMTVKNVGDCGTETTCIWNASHLSIFLTLLDRSIESFDRSVRMDRISLIPSRHLKSQRVY